MPALIAQFSRWMYRCSPVIGLLLALSLVVPVSIYSRVANPARSITARHALNGRF